MGNKKIKNQRFIKAVLVFLLVVNCIGCSLKSAVENKTGITWVLNEDGSYTFTNNDGTDSSIYAWYVLDENNEVIYRTGYSESPDFVWDLEGNRDLKIKGFIRTGTEEEYEQISIMVEASDIFYENFEYEILSVDLTDEILDSIDTKVSVYETYITVDEVLAGNGDRWDMDLTIPVDWSCTGITNRSYGFWTNALLFLDCVYVKYSETKDKIYSDLILDYIIDWCTQNKERIDENAWAWHDDATALRVLRMSYFYYLFKEDCTFKEQKLIESSLQYQAELLNSDEFYTKNHNHGMHQDMGLFSYAVLLAEDDLKEKYISTALNRTGRYLDFVYTTDGVHKEHSPYYARDVLIDTIIFKRFTKEICPEFSEKLDFIIENAQEFLIQIMNPNLIWPSIGDSSIKIPDCSFALENNSKYEYITTNGKYGLKPEDEIVFKDGGYAVFRSSWDDEPDEATWILFLAATFSSTHKHSDDLSFLLYHKGDLFVEGGKRDYNYLEEQTKWAYSSYAHNVLLVNGEGYPVKYGANGFQSIYPEALETRIVDYDLSGNVKTVSGVQKRYENVGQTRTLEYDKENNVVVITDSLELSEDLNGTLLFHIADGVEVRSINDGWELFRGNELVAVVQVESEYETQLSTIIGDQGEYPYCTWIFNGDSEPTYGSLLIVDIECNKGINQVLTNIYLK